MAISFQPSLIIDLHLTFLFLWFIPRSKEQTTKPLMELAYGIILMSLTWLMLMLKLFKRQNPEKSESTMLAPGKVLLTFGLH